MSGSQEHIDSFYFERGPCCAGCDLWRHINSVAGTCTLMPIEYVTTRDHLCGQFRDTFEWASLPAHYRRSVGDPKAPTR